MGRSGFRTLQLTRVLLIDADIIAYQASAALETRVDWDGTGDVSVAADWDATRRAARDQIDWLMERLDGQRLVVCLSDDFQNFRKKLYPAYKSNRVGERPVHLYKMKDWLEEKYTSQRYDTLEADDVMGIMATTPTTEDRIMVSDDKDMMTVPGLLFRPTFHADKGVLDINPLEAMRFHFWQTIVGDPTDGYPGARGVGKESPYAQDVLEAEDELEAWDEVLMAYTRCRLTEEDAVLQANLARILKYGEWDGTSVKPWLPPAGLDELLVPAN